MGCSECLCEDTGSVVLEAMLGKSAATPSASRP
jgi:hypothetical protein